MVVGFLTMPLRPLSASIAYPGGGRAFDYDNDGDDDLLWPMGMSTRP